MVNNTQVYTGIIVRIDIKKKEERPVLLLQYRNCYPSRDARNLT